MIILEPHPLLKIGAFTCQFPAPLGELATPAELKGLLSLQADAPCFSDDECRQAIRDLLKHGGYKPSGRGKPASEYLVRAASQEKLQPINLAVDACNAASLHSGFPISVVDLDRAQPPFRIAVAESEESYVFNASGQEIHLGGLLCIYDAEGACASGVKDSQRTKTQPGTVRTLSVVWGTHTYADRLHRAVTWYRGILEQAGVLVHGV
ncbi:MAG: phenylalanine--tRNA ligase beta subunit-related protein [Planctomycetota bacterium]